MSQIALNIIAIGIFLMTMITLLGPIFHIPAIVPVAITFAILSLATVDTLGLNSRGVSLLLDLFASKQQRQRIINHEAGHFLVAYFLGIPITGYTVTAWEAIRQGQLVRGGVSLDTSSLNVKPFKLEKMRLTLERFCTVWMAGVAAEKMVYGDSQGGREDREQLRQALIMAGLPENSYEQKERWACLQAANLLTRHQQSFEALVKAMNQKASVEECYGIIQECCDIDSEQLAA